MSSHAKHSENTCKKKRSSSHVCIHKSVCVEGRRRLEFKFSSLPFFSLPLSFVPKDRAPFQALSLSSSPGSFSLLPLPTPALLPLLPNSQLIHTHFSDANIHSRLCLCSWRLRWPAYRRKEALLKERWSFFNKAGARVWLSNLRPPHYVCNRVFISFHH